MATSADRIAAALRPIAPDGKLLQAEIPLINALGQQWDDRRKVISDPAVAPAMDPPWIAQARTKIGEREIPGSKQNPWIVSNWQRLGAKWFNDDETPWCGNFAAWALDAAGLPYPKEFPRAASFATYGTACAAQLGAIGVKSRVGGNHVFFIVGQTPDKMYYKALGGNQSDMVCIIDIKKVDVDAIRWPQGVPVPKTPYLPILPAGKISTKEG
jgi:uncharacterized protein (TIGR02594 family)